MSRQRVPTREVGPLAAVQSTISFTSIPQTYRHLRVIWQARCDGGNAYQQMGVRFNGDSGSNYIYVAWDSGGTFNSGSVTTGYIGYVAAGGSTAGDMSGGIITIPNYAGSLWKMAMNNGWEGSLNRIGGFGARWSNTAAITSLTFVLDANNFGVGSVFTLYLDY